MSLLSTTDFKDALTSTFDTDELYNYTIRQLIEDGSPYPTYEDITVDIPEDRCHCQPILLNKTVLETPADGIVSNVAPFMYVKLWNDGQTPFVQGGSLDVRQYSKDGAHRLMAEFYLTIIQGGFSPSGRQWCNCQVNGYQIYGQEDAGIPVDDVNFQFSALTGEVGQTISCFVNVEPYNATDRTLTFTSTNEAVAVFVTGVGVQINGVGNCVITAVSTNGIFDQITVYGIAATVHVDSITIDQGDTLTIVEGQVIQLTCTFNPASTVDKSVTWTTSDNTIATVNPATGEVVGVLGGGDVTITATSNVDTTAIDSIAIHINEASTDVTSVTIDQTSPQTMTIHSTLQLTATVLPSDASDKRVNWGIARLDNPSLPTNFNVNTNGYVSVATYEEGEEATVTVASVSNPAVNGSIVIHAFSNTDEPTDRPIIRMYGVGPTGAVQSPDNAGLKCKLFNSVAFGLIWMGEKTTWTWDNTTASLAGYFQPTDISMLWPNNGNIAYSGVRIYTYTFGIQKFVLQESDGTYTLYRFRRDPQRKRVVPSGDPFYEIPPGTANPPYTSLNAAGSVLWDQYCICEVDTPNFTL